MEKLNNTIEWIFWSPLWVLGDVGLLSSLGLAGLLVAFGLFIASTLLQVRRRKFHVPYLMSIIGITAACFAETHGAHPWFAPTHIFFIGYTVAGILMLSYGVATRRCRGWFPLYLLPSILGGSVWALMIRLEIERLSHR